MCTSKFNLARSAKKNLFTQPQILRGEAAETPGKQIPFFKGTVFINRLVYIRRNQEKPFA